ncbi:hypothetical protein CHUAL_009919 [Chamberlinius hualienensis]
MTNSAVKQSVFSKNSQQNGVIGKDQNQNFNQDINGENESGDSSINEIYQSLATFGKYLGIVQLPDKGHNTRSYFCNVKSITLMAFQIFTLVIAIRLLISLSLHDENKGMEFIVALTVNALVHTLGPAVHIFYHCKGSRKLKYYLRAHHTIEKLLKPKKTELRRYAVVGMGLSIIMMLIRSGIIISQWQQSIATLQLDVGSWFFPNTLLVAIIIYIIGFIVMAFSECHIYFAYIFFQHVIKSAFEELTTQIEEDALIPMDIGATVTKIKTFRQLHRQLCKLCKLLNGLMSPMILVDYIVYTFCTVASTFRLIRLLCGPIIDNWQPIIFSSTVIIIQVSIICLMSASAASTVAESKKVLPAVFLSMDLSSTDAKEEVN